jgi:hypothetical protein
MQELRYGRARAGESTHVHNRCGSHARARIGATHAIFSVVDSLLLKPLQYPDADRIVRVLTHFNETNRRQNVSGGDLVEARDSSGLFSAFSWFYGDEIGVRARRADRSWSARGS